MTSAGILPSRSMRALSPRSTRNFSSRSMKGRARSRSAGFIVGKGWTSSSRNEPSNSSRTKLGACHSFSPAPSATSRASCSVASSVRGGLTGGVRTSVMARALGEGGGPVGGETAKPVQHEGYDVALATLEILEGLEVDAHRRGHRACVDEGEPAERDDAEEELRRVARFRVVESEPGTDRRERL